MKTEKELRNKPGVIAEFAPSAECNGFWRLSVANGCLYDCDYCYLKGTWIKDVPVVFTDIVGMAKNIRKWMSKTPACILNSGELSDSLLFDEYQHWVEPIATMFEFKNNGGHDLLLLTKSDKIDPLRRLYDEYGPYAWKHVIVSWSVTSDEVYQFETDTPPIKERLQCALEAKTMGFRVRLRIDPIIPFPAWRKDYASLMGMIEQIRPERVTLGTLRFRPRTAAMSRLGPMVPELDTGRLRFPRWHRKEIYDEVRRMLNASGVAEVALCKEPKEVREELGMTNPCHCMM